MTDSDLATYYSRRAAEYERVYAKPERQAELALLREVVAQYFTGRRVLEVACGTGYWTAVFAAGAKAVVATDVSHDVLAVARSNPLPAGRVAFRIADAYDVSEVQGEFDASFAGFWWSHVPRRRRSELLSALHNRLGAGARVMIVDNRYVEGSSTPVSRTDDNGNTFQHRALDDGTQHEILKNFPTVEDVGACLREGGATRPEVVSLKYYWYATYEVGPKA